MQTSVSALVALFMVVLVFVEPGHTHFGMVIPSDNIVSPAKKKVDLTLSFSHPFEMVGMDMVKPKRFFVSRNGQQTELLDSLSKKEVLGRAGWQATYPVRRPGVYHFVMEPEPYWEPAEDALIIHYTKTTIAAYGGDTGWEEVLGLPTEIVPLLRPFGNYGGNSFSGQVLLHGKPLPYAEVEVELYNEENRYRAPSDYHVTQLVRADANGIFSFTCPAAGWWGFAALSEADYTLPNPDGTATPVELGAVYWIYLDPLGER